VVPRSAVEQSAAGKPVRALIFDLDGTLYRQRPVRLRILRRLLTEILRSPGRGFRTVRMLSAYRAAQENLRNDAASGSGSTDSQIALACAVTGEPVSEVRQCVERWMQTEPLTLLRASVPVDLFSLLERCRSAGLRLAVLSDYPATQKLEAMGLVEFFDVIVCADDPEIRRFKPDPLGLAVTLRRLGVAAAQGVYVGDRLEVDGAAAARAGMRFVLMTSSPRQPRTADAWLIVHSFDELAAHVLNGSEI
jgi:FMN phosphatase YigB (HAD superfamily)